MMRKVWTIARREFGAMVATKAFLLSVTLMPVLMFGGIFVANWLKDVRDVSDKFLVLIDGTRGALFDALEEAVAARNASLPRSEDGSLTVPKYVLLREPVDAIADERRLELSDQVRDGKISAFVEIPSDLFDETPADSPGVVAFYAQNPLLADERRWIERSIDEVVTASRLERMQIDAEAVRQATRSVPLTALGLYKRAADGSILSAVEANNMAGVFVPFAFVMLMFMVVFLTAQPMLESVLEEKSQRIAEVLLGSVNPFQLMLGKLLGGVAGSLSILAIYGVGAYAAAAYNNWTDLIPFEMTPWFVVYQILAVLLFSAIFMAVGAAVSQLKEAQSLLMPVWLVMALPLFVWLQVVRGPNGAIATGMSFFPPAIPMVMVLRLASESVIPLWQIMTGLAILLATTLLGVYLAGRVFRIGILWQGKTPRLSELVKWAWRG